MRRVFFARAGESDYGGAERYLARLREALKELGYESEVLHSPIASFLPSWIRVPLYERYICRMREKFAPGDILFSLERVSCADIYRAGDGVHRAFLEHKGFSLNPLHPILLHMERRCFENSSKIIANSRLVKREIVDCYGIDEDKIEVIYNGINIPESFDSALARKRLSKEFSMKPGEKMILFVGSGFERKGVAEFLEILSRLKGEYRAFVVGKEKRMGRYLSIAKRLGIGGRVVFTGPRRDVELFYAAADIFLFPTRYEPFSNVVLEAMSYATAVFTTSRNGASEILDDYFVMKEPLDSLVAEKIDRLLEDEESLLLAASKARERASSFTIERNAKETLALIGKVV
jgi:UDP-glucose:(heptosyl)LPS alpha-1,3-glucosyltransferase